MKEKLIQNGIAIKMCIRDSHSTLVYGQRFTIIRNLKDELKTGTYNAMLKQLNINEDEWR